MMPRVAERQPTDAALDAALDALSQPGRFRAAEARVARAAPRLEQILVQALHQGGWFGDAHDAQVRAAVRAEHEAERTAAVHTLLAEETRLGMLVGVAVGWELARELEGPNTPSQGD